jgi:hypothetical protein
VIVESVHGRFRKRLRDEGGGHTVSAADIGHFGSGGELVDDTVERGQPFSDEICAVSRPEELFGSCEQLRVVLVPAEARLASWHSSASISSTLVLPEPGSGESSTSLGVT